MSADITDVLASNGVTLPSHNKLELANASRHVSTQLLKLVTYS